MLPFQQQAPGVLPGLLRNRDWLAFALIVVFVGAVAVPTFQWTLVNDDLYHIRRSGDSLNRQGLISMWTSSQANDEANEYGWTKYAMGSDLYRPVLDLSFALERVLYGFWYPGYRLTNVLLHAGACCCVYFFCFTVFGSRAAAILAAILFAILHGNRSVYLSQVAGRTDSLAGFFVLLSVCFFLAYRSRQKRAFLALFLLTGFLGMSSKEIALGLPFLLLACDAFLFGLRPLRRLWIHSLSFGLLLAYLGARLWVLGGLGASHANYSFSPRRIVLHLMAIPEALVPVRLELQHAWLWAPLLLAALVLAWLVLRGEAFQLRVTAFTALAYYIGAGAAVLFSPRGRYAYISTGFLMAWLAFVLVRALRPPSRIAILRRVVPAIALLSLVAMVATNFARTWQILREGSRAAGIAKSFKRDLRHQIGRMSPGDKLIVLSAPSNCGGQPIFYNGLQDWVRLLPGNRIQPLVLSLVDLHSCRPWSSVVASESSAGTFDVHLATSDAPASLLLPQVEMAQLQAGETLENRSFRATANDASPLIRIGRSGASWSERRFTSFTLQVNPALLHSPGANHFVMHDGEGLFVLSGGEWRRVVAQEALPEWP